MGWGGSDEKKITGEQHEITELTGLGAVCQYEQTECKMADYRHHLRFSLRCRKNRITPKSLQMSSVKALKQQKYSRRHSTS